MNFLLTHKKSCHDGAVHGVQQMCLHAHPAATEGGKNASVRPSALPKNTHASAGRKLFTCVRLHNRLQFANRCFWIITHLSSKYFFLATAWIDAGTRGKPGGRGKSVRSGVRPWEPVTCSFQTHPSRGGSTSAGAAPRRTRPPR